MRVFVTGATGFVGSAVVSELIGAGHRVLGLARSEASAAALEALGADVHRGSLDDLASLKRGAEASDGVIHAAFNHDFFTDTSGRDFFSLFEAAAETDRAAIEALGDALAGSNRPLIVTSGTGMSSPGRLTTEDDVPPSGSSLTPRVSEQTAALMVARGVRASVVRLPQVHGDGDRRGFVPGLIHVAREKGVSGYVDEGSNRWPAVHRLDAASLYRLALEGAPAGSRFHAVADEGVSLRDIATVIGRQLNVPVASVPREAVGDHFGWVAFLVALDNPSSSRLTRERLGWRPAQRGLIEDLEQGSYFDGPTS